MTEESFYRIYTRTTETRLALNGKDWLVITDDGQALTPIHRRNITLSLKKFIQEKDNDGDKDINLYRWHINRADCTGLFSYEGKHPKACPGCGQVN